MSGISRRSLAAAVVAAVLAGPAAGTARAFGRGDSGTSGAQFLKLAPGARPAGMGEAFGGVADDVHAVYYNPAGLGFLDHVEVAGMHDSHFQDVNYEFGALAVPLLSWTDSKEARSAAGVLGAAIYSLSVANIQRRGVVETDAPTDTFGAQDFAYSLAYAYAPNPRLSAGAALKVIDQTLDSAHASAVALDAGALYRQGRLSAGGGWRNLGTQPRFGQVADPLPLVLYGGGGYRVRPDWLVSAEMRIPKDNLVGFSLGTEYSRKFPGSVTGTLRGGYNTTNNDASGLTGLSLGAGVGLGGFTFDFAWVPFGDLGNTFRYSVVVRF